MSMEALNDGSLVSVIIRCRNEERWIGHAIQSVLDQLPGAEIIVLNNHSTDDSIRIVREFMGFDNVRFLEIEDYTPGRALNVGAREASRDILFVLSAHCVLKVLDLPKIAKELGVHKALFGRQVPIFRGKKITPRYLWANFGEEKVENFYSVSEDRYFIHNALCFYNRQFLLEHPFDEELAGKEDRYWAKDMVKAGYSYIYDPTVLIGEHHWTRDGNTWKGVG